MAKLDLTESRYHRQELIQWWDQTKLGAARVLVVGAGAIGNEVVKNLALVGIGHITVCDMDTIEHSNLARCVFFREEHEGRHKAEVLAEQASAMNPDITVVGSNLAVQRLGLAFFEQFDIVIGALDNREARAWVNQACRKLGKYWIDGAIEGLRGIVRMFAPTGACYACTLTDADYKQMSHRRSCALLAPEEILSGKTPTNATTAGIVAGIQVQEAIKFLVGKEELLSLVGKCWTYIGDTMTSYVVGYAPDEYCMAHDDYTELKASSEVATLADLASALGIASETIQAIDFEEDLITIEPCANCGSGSLRHQLRSSLEPGAGRCASCDKDYPGNQVTAIAFDDERAKLPLSSFGFAELDVVTFRTIDDRIHAVVRGTHG